MDNKDTQRILRSSSLVVVHELPQMEILSQGFWWGACLLGMQQSERHVTKSEVGDQKNEVKQVRFRPHDGDAVR